jgi:tetratricopeptide (TPR) repeat protein/predicted Ser/Thr protein kinase
MAFNPKADLRSLFDQALDLPPIARAEFLREVQFKAPKQYFQLRELLIAHAGSHKFFDELEREGNLWGQFTPPSMIGRRFGNYVVEEELGRGGMGTVYKASRADDVFYKTVAIKVISGGAALSESALEAFRRERQILAQLEHPNIARLLDAGSTPDGLLYLVMEYVDGQPINTYIEQNDLHADAVLRLFLRVCEAVAFAHRNLVIHRDLKPSNILVDASGQVKLLDFGIAKVLSPGREVTATLALRLTPEFASPEQIRNSAVSTVSDVYSLGVILFHLLTGGEQPYRTTSQAVPDLLNAVLENEVPKPSTVAKPPKDKALRGDLDNIILKAMAKEPERRYASVERLEEDIRRHLSGRPVQARPATFAYRTLKFWQRNRLGISAAALLLLAIASGVWSTWRQAEIAQHERLRAETERLAALDAKARAEEQRQLAEQRSREADAARLIAESRYQNARSLASAILTDVNDSLQKLPGAESARRQALLAAMKHLEELGAKSTEDADLLQDLARAYEQTGELLRTLNDQDQDTARLALPALEKGHALRKRIVQINPQDTNAQLALSASKRILGNGYYSAGQAALAIKQYQDSLALLRPYPQQSNARNLAVLAHSNLCTAHTQANAFAKALEHCRAAIQDLETLEPAGVRLVNLYLQESDLLLRTKQAKPALAALRQAWNRLHPSTPGALEIARAVQEKAKTLEGGNVLAAQALRLHGVLLARNGRRDEALECFEESLVLLGSAKPAMREVLAYAEYAEKLPDPRILSSAAPAGVAELLLAEAAQK